MHFRYSIRNLLASFFSRHSDFLISHPVHFIVIPLVLMYLSGGGLRVLIQQKARGTDEFFPTDAEVLRERGVLRQRWPVHPRNFYKVQINNLQEYLTILMYRKDGADMLDLETMQNVSRVYGVLRRKFRGYDAWGREYRFRSLCQKYSRRCVDGKKHVELLIFMLKHKDEEGFEPIFSYPEVQNLKGQLSTFLGDTLGGVIIKGEKEPRINENIITNLLQNTAHKTPSSKKFQIDANQDEMADKLKRVAETQGELDNNLQTDTVRDQQISTTLAGSRPTTRPSVILDANTSATRKIIRPSKFESQTDEIVSEEETTTEPATTTTTSPPKNLLEMESVGSVAVRFYLRHDTPELQTASRNWTETVINQLATVLEEESPGLDAVVASPHSMYNGLVASEQKLMRFFMLAYIALSVVAVICTIRWAKRGPPGSSELGSCSDSGIGLTHADLKYDSLKAKHGVKNGSPPKSKGDLLNLQLKQNPTILAENGDKLCKNDSSIVNTCSKSDDTSKEKAVKSISANRWTIDWTSSKMGVGLCGVTLTQFGIICSFGSLLYIREHYTSINVLIPFLVSSVGIDDTFIVLNAWYQTDPHDTVETRIKTMLCESGLAVTVTSATSVFSFLVSMISKTPSVSSFCAHAAFGLTTTYLYMITTLPAIMFLTEKYSWPTLAYWKQADITIDFSKDVRSILNRFKSDKPLVVQPESSIAVHGLVRQLVEKHYNTFLFRPWVKSIVAVSVFVYWAFAAWGIKSQAHGMEGHFLVPNEHYFAKYYFHFRDLYLPRGQRVHIVINNAPDLSVAAARADMMDIAEKIEDLHHIMPREGTTFFLRTFMQFTESQKFNDDRQWHNFLASWSTFTATRQLFGSDLIWRTVSEEEADICRCKKILTGFRFYVTLDNIHSFQHRIDAQHSLRKVAAQYPQYNITSFHDQWRIIDQQLAVIPNTRLTIGVAVLVVVIVSLLVFESFLCGIIICVAIVSIAIGVIGFSGLLNINLDGITSILFTMSVGFSIDYCAHMVHSHVSAKHRTPKKAGNSTNDDENRSLKNSKYIEANSQNMIDPCSQSPTKINVKINDGYQNDIHTSNKHDEQKLKNTSQIDTPEPRLSSEKRAKQALSEMVVPIAQGAFSTIVGTSFLTFVNAHVVRAFYTVLFCVVAFGLLHACVFLPVALSCEDWIIAVFNRAVKKVMCCLPR